MSRIALFRNEKRRILTFFPKEDVMPEHANEAQPVDPFKPYKGRFKEHHALPAQGRDKDDIFKELSLMAAEENAKCTAAASTCSNTK